MPLPDVHYVDSGGLDIAYTIYGEGPADVVLCPGLAAHLELNEEIPFYRSLIEVFGGRARLVMFDKRGFGLSDRRRLGSTEENVADLVAVLDGAQVERCALIGTGDSGTYAIAAAAMIPERITSLMLHASTPRYMDDPGSGWVHGLNEEEHRATIRAVLAGWGTGYVMDLIFSGHPDDDATRRALARWERNIATPRVAGAHLESFLTVDVRHLLGRISCPTLLVHNSGDSLMPVTWGRAMATAIPNATLIEQSYPFHIGWTEAAEETARRMRDFVFGADGGPASERSLLTVLFTDVVASTEQARSAGDERWRHILDRFEGRAEQVVAAYGGRVVKTTGDGLLATFDAPGRAIAAARALRQAASPLNLRLRTGLHTGEVERRRDDIGGIAVHLAARIQALAEADQILVSRTVVDLTTGSAGSYTSVGRRALKGFEETWELFVVP